MSNCPIYVADLQQGMVVRIQLSHGLVVKCIGPGRAVIQPNQRAMPYRRSSFVGFVISNDFQNRSMMIDFQDLTIPTEHFKVSVNYKQILVIEKQLDGTYVSSLKNPLRIPAYTQVLGVF